MSSVQKKSEVQVPFMEPEEKVEDVKTRPIAATIILAIGVTAIVIGMAASISIGVRDIHLGTVFEAVFAFNPNNDLHQIITSLRLPRAIAGAMVGAGFAVAGAIMQGMTRNPLADPGLLGVNAGASFVLVIAFAFFPSLPFEYLILFSFIGAGLGAGIVYGIAFFTPGGLSPLKLAIAGAVIGSLLTGLSQAFTLLFQITYDLTFWSAGGISTAEWFQVSVMAPWIIFGLVIALFISRYITILSLGEDVAKGLGQRTTLIKAIGIIAVLILTGAAVATVGGIGFVGLVIPHIVRGIVGVDYRWVIPNRCHSNKGSRYRQL